jgi:hypothetical protein
MNHILPSQGRRLCRLLSLVAFCALTFAQLSTHAATDTARVAKYG